MSRRCCGTSEGLGEVAAARRIGTLQGLQAGRPTTSTSRSTNAAASPAAEANPEANDRIERLAVAALDTNKKSSSPGFEWLMFLLGWGKR